MRALLLDVLIVDYPKVQNILSGNVNYIISSFSSLIISRNQSVIEQHVKVLGGVIVKQELAANTPRLNRLLYLS